MATRASRSPAADKMTDSHTARNSPTAKTSRNVARGEDGVGTVEVSRRRPGERAIPAVSAVHSSRPPSDPGNAASAQADGRAALFTEPLPMHHSPSGRRLAQQNERH